MIRFALAAVALLVLAGPWAVGLGAARAQGITTRITETPQVSQPGPFSTRGRTVVVPRTQIEIDQGNSGPAVVPAAPAAPGASAPSVPPSAPLEVTGKIKAVDGDTLEVGGILIRLYGIAAPPADAKCGTGTASWPCGQEAIFAMAYETAEHWASCTGRPPPDVPYPHESSAPEAAVAVCRLGPYDLAAIMVRKGWALAEPGAAPGYAGEESEARLAGAGIWRGGFVPPEAWRTRHTSRAP